MIDKSPKFRYNFFFFCVGPTKYQVVDGYLRFVPMYVVNLFRSSTTSVRLSVCFDLSCCGCLGSEGVICIPFENKEKWSHVGQKVLTAMIRWPGTHSYFYSGVILLKDISVLLVDD